MRDRHRAGERDFGLHCQRTVRKAGGHVHVVTVAMFGPEMEFISLHAIVQ